MKFTFTGCSFTVGVGLPLEKTDKNNYCNLVGEHYLAGVTNLGQSGNSNYNIFMSAVNEMLTHKPDMLFVQWSGLTRKWLYPGPNTYITIGVDWPLEDYIYRDLKFSRSQLRFFNNQYQLLNHDFQNIIAVINYSNILSKLGNVTFVNGLLPWSEDLANLQTLTNPAEQFSEYTKNLLDFDNRDDKELTELFLELYKHIQSLNTKQWVNMFNSMFALRIDKGNDDIHPGPKSHKQYSNMIINHLENIKGIQ